MKSKFLKFKIIIFLVIISAFYLPLFTSTVLAVDYLPLVPCGLSQEAAGRLKTEGKGDPAINYSRPCARCDAFKLTENVIDFALLGIVPPVAAVLFVAAGLMIVLAGANQKLYATGISIFKDTFIGLLIILGSWVIVNTFIQSFGPDQAKGSWFKFTCKDNVITGPGGPGGVCFTPDVLAQQYNTAYPRQNAPELNALISCVNSRIGQFIDQGQVYSYERNNDSCNYTRGQTVCGGCEHEISSCHYGGASGTTGARAVDFNAVGISEQELFNRLSAIRNECGFGFILFEDSHTHVSTPSCTGDTGGD